MSEQQLRQDLQKLKAVIEALPANDVQRVRLAALVQDMEQHLQQSGSNLSVAGLQQQLQAAVSRFESSHPTVVAIINNVLVTLGNMGV